MSKTFRLLLLISLWVVGMTSGWAQSEPKKSPPPSDPVNVSGTWNLSVETPQGNGTPTATFVQEGEKLTGRYKGMFGEAKLTGSVKNRTIQFSVPVNAQGTDVVFTYSGRLDGDRLKGTVQLGEYGSGTWTATRAKPEEGKKEGPQKKKE